MEAVIEEKTPENPIEENVVYVALAVSCLFLFTRVVEIRLGHIFALLVAYIIITRMQEERSEDVVSFNTEIDYRLDLLGAPSHFHTDINIINFFYDIYDWRVYNRGDFDSMIRAVNNILMIEDDTTVADLERCVDNYDVAYGQMKIALHLLHSFVYTLDHPEKINKLKTCIGRLVQLLQRHIQAIQRNCESSDRPVNVCTRFINDAFAPKPSDETAVFDYS